MSVEITYKCDTCRDETEKEDIYAVVFGGMKDFRLVSFRNPRFTGHEGIHVCKSCLDQYRATNTKGEQ